MAGNCKKHQIIRHRSAGNLSHRQSTVYDHGSKRVNFHSMKNGKADAANPKVQEWEDADVEISAAVALGKAGEKWILMNKIFQLRNNLIAPL